MSVMDAVGERAGQAAGGLLGGFIGGLIGGPVGAWVGRAAGSYGGRIAGKILASQLASMMEEANEDAETETKEEAAAEPCKDCAEIACFDPPKGSTPEEIAEFERQLKEQQDAINNMRPEDILDNMEKYDDLGRKVGEALDRAKKRAEWLRNRTDTLRDQYIGSGMSKAEAAIKAGTQATNESKTLDVIHTPDLGAGGDGRLSGHNGGLGPRSANRSIGSQWSKKGRDLRGKSVGNSWKNMRRKPRRKGKK